MYFFINKGVSSTFFKVKGVTYPCLSILTAKEANTKSSQTSLK